MKEVWRPVKGFEKWYEISNKGNLRSLTRKIERSNGVIMTVCGQNLKPTQRKDGYVHVALSVGVKGKRYTPKIHRLVAESFLPKIEGHNEVNHKNGIKHDNRVENLEWSTRSKNVKHAFATNLRSHKGKNHPSYKRGGAIRDKAKEMWASGNYSQEKISKKLGMSQKWVSLIVNNKLWKSLDEY